MLVIDSFDDKIIVFFTWSIDMNWNESTGRVSSKGKSHAYPVEGSSVTAVELLIFGGGGRALMGRPLTLA